MTAVATTATKVACLSYAARRAFSFFSITDRQEKVFWLETAMATHRATVLGLSLSVPQWRESRMAVYTAVP